METVIKDIIEEVERVSIKVKPYHSLHEGYGVMLEEFDELWDEIKKKDRNLTRIYSEAKQVACTSIRFMQMVEKMKIEKGIIT